MYSGVVYALMAGMMWGLVFVVPLLLPDYPPSLLSLGRYLAFGLIALPLAWLDRRNLAGLTRQDWIEALKLAGKGAKTMEGQEAKISVMGGTPMIGNAHIVKTDIMAKNGIIHVIDAVILPPAK